MEKIPGNIAGEPQKESLKNKPLASNAERLLNLMKQYSDNSSIPEEDLNALGYEKKVDDNGSTHVVRQGAKLAKKEQENLIVKPINKRKVGGTRYFHETDPYDK